MDEPAGEPAADDVVAAIERGLAEAVSLGLVGLTEAGLRDWRHWDAIVELRDAGRLPLPVDVFLSSGLFFGDGPAAGRVADARADADASGDGGDHGLRIVGVKLYADGWLGPRTCACSEPFADVAPPDDGILFLDADGLAARVEAVASAGLRVATHAIGDRAIEAALDAYERAYGGADGCRAARPRIEHAQVLRPDLIERIAALGVVCCIQPCFASSDADSIRSALAGRFPDAYRWDRLIAAGAEVIAGSDYPIETLDPSIGLERLTSGDHPLDADTARRIMTVPLIDA